jgi:hypothetical protein
MLARLRPHLSYANVVSTACLFVLLGGSAYAAVTLKRGSVKGKHVAKNAITSPKVKQGTLRPGDFRPGVLPPAGSRVAGIVVKRIDVPLPAGPADNVPGPDQNVSVGCAVDERIIGGAAASINTSGEVLASRSASDDNAGTPEDGGGFTHWYARVRSKDDSPQFARVFAICMQVR